MNQAGDPLIETLNAHLGYGKRIILKDVSLAIRPGESVGLVGPNGSGKTTFLKGILGNLKPSRGTLQVDRSRRFAYVPQIDDINWLWPLTIRETVLLALRARNFLGRISKEEAQFGQSAMDVTGISQIQDLLLRNASGGQRQRAILAQALSQKPDVLLLDEPTRGLDVVAERDFLALVENLKKEQNLTILFVTHSLHIPLNFMQRILLFNNNQVTDSTPHELLHTRKLEDVYGVPFAQHDQQGLRWVMPLTRNKPNP